MFFFSLGQAGVFLELKMWYEYEIYDFATCKFLGISAAGLFESVYPIARLHGKFGCILVFQLVAAWASICVVYYL